LLMKLCESKQPSDGFWRHRRVLITGATGFLGSHLTRRLLWLGAEIYVFVRPSSKHDRIADVLPQLHVIKNDLLDSVSVRDGVNQADPEVVFHMAAFGVDRPLDDPKNAALVNIMGVVHLLEAVRERELRRFIYTGTCYEYTGDQSPVGPDSNMEPTNIYAATKSSGALVCQAYRRTYGLPLIIIRPFQGYGPWQGTRLLIPYLITSLLKGKIVKLTSGKQVRDYVFVDDVVCGMLLGAENECAIGESFNLGSGKGIQVRSIVERVLNLLDGNTRVEFGAVPHRPSEIWSLWSDNLRANELLGWHPMTTLDDGLKKTVEWYVSRPNFM